jgi:hypothetical protein
MNIIEQDHRRLGKPWRTRTGLLVGGSYIRPAPMPAGDDERIQSALLAGPKPRADLHELGHRLIVPVCCVTGFLLVLAMWLGVLE